MSWNKYIHITCDAVFDGSICGAWADVNVDRATFAREHLPVGWRRARHPKRGLLDLCPLCAAALGKLDPRLDKSDMPYHQASLDQRIAAGVTLELP
jgi:hypothetical protein